MKPMSLTSPEAIASEYGGNKKAIANAARMGLLDPTAALMAGMFIDRMRSAAAEEQKANTTVAQDVFNAPMQQQGLPQAPMQAQQPAPTPAPQPQGIPAAQMAAAQPQMAPGVEGLPTGEVGEYAGGGIVAFANEGLVQGDSTQDFFDQYANDPIFRAIYEGHAREEQDARERQIQDNMKRNALIAYEIAKDRDAAQNIPVTKNIQARPAIKLPGIMQGVDLSTPFSRLPRAGETTPDMARLMETRRAVQDTMGLPAVLKGRPDLTTPFDRFSKPGETTKEDAARMETRRAVQDAFGLPAITKGRTDLTTPFDRVSPEAVSSTSPTTTLTRGFPVIDSGASKTTAPKVDVYGLPVPDPEANLALAKQQAKSLITVPKEESQAEAIAATKDLYTAMGVDPDLYKRHIAKLETEREGLKADKEEAKWTRLIEAGLGVMAGKSQHAAINIGEGASPALKGFAQDIKDVKKADRELTRAQMALETSENQFKVDQSKSVQSRMEKNQDRVDKAQQTLATATATLGNSLNTLSGTTYSSQLHAASAKENALLHLEGQKYAADKGLEGQFANAAAHKYASDHKERMIRNIMASEGISYMQAIERLGEAEHPKDRFNAIHNAITAYNTSVANDLKILGLDGRRSELMRDPVKNAEEIKKLDAKEAEIRAVRKKEYAITEDDYKYLEQEGKRLSGKGAATPTQSRPAPAPAPVVAPPAAIADLKKNPSAKAKADFDAIFGKGAADKALGTK